MTQFWILVAPTLLALCCLIALQPYRSMRVALRSTRRTDGSWRRDRMRIELRQLWRYLRHAVVVPLLALATIQVALAVTLEWIGGGSILADLYGEYHPEVALHAADLDELAALADEARQARSGPRPLITLLLENWPLWPAYLVVTASGITFFVSVRLPRLARRYVDGVSRRTRRHTSVYSTIART